MSKALEEKLLADIHTKGQVNDFLTSISEILPHSFKTSSFEKSLSQIPLIYAEKIKLFIEQSKIDFQDKLKIEASLKSLEKDLAEIPSLQVVLGFEPSLGFIQVLSHWFEANLDKKIILDVSTDKSLIGGMVLYAGDKFKDLSLKRKFEQIIN